MRTKRILAAAAMAVALAVAVTACGSSNSSSSGGGGSSSGSKLSGTINGAGATFPLPVYQEWAARLKDTKGLTVNYQGIGSGGGIAQFTAGTVDFGATDSPMEDSEVAAAKKKGDPVHVPSVFGAVTVSYNVQGVDKGLKLDGKTVADIFLGKIKKWNDPRIAALNAGATLPNSDILVVHRSDGSGTTFIFTDYLSKVSPEWARVVGKGKEVKWPTGIGAKGNEGVAGQVKQTPGAIAYVELAYAKQNNLPYASIRNAAGNFVQPTMETIYAAAESAAPNIPANTDYRISIVNAPGANAYPIASFTWLLVYRNPQDTAKARLLTDFLKWALTDGSAAARALDFGPLPPAMAERLKARLDSIAPGAGT